MRIPKEIKIGPFTYQIKRPEVLYNEKGQELYGQISYAEQVIRLSQVGSIERQESSLLHEIIHGVLDQTGHADEVEEEIVETLGIGLYEVLKENGLLRED